MTNNIDDTDRKILSVLAKEGRISNLELAERIGLSPTPCSRRVSRLERKGIILGYGAKISQRALGNTVSVLVQVRLSMQTPTDIDEFMSAIARLPEITECLLVTGSVDYILKVEAKNVEALRDFVLKELKAIPSVAETSTMLILDIVKASN